MSAQSNPPKLSAAQTDLEALLSRLRQRQYPETIPVLASYWLKTVYERGHQRGWWKELNEHLTQVLRDESLASSSRNALVEIQEWIQRRGVLASKTPESSPEQPEPFRPNLKPEWLAPYVARLLNEWLLAEVARLLIDENEVANTDAGTPVLVAGRALEQLLVRERLSPGTLEMLLEPKLLSPQYVYPSDVEMLRDVVLALLGRTAAPPPPVLPAAILGATAHSALAGFREAVESASINRCHGVEEIHVPLRSPSREWLESGHRIAPILITMDGRWWACESLRGGESHLAVYRAGGRLRVDYSGEHAKLVVPWPETQLRWAGGVHVQDPLEIFGREWHASSWETDGDRTTLHLVFSRVLPIAEIHPAAETVLRRSHPAAVDMAWAALENALATAIVHKSVEPLEALSRPDFIPLGRAVFGLAESMNHWRLPKREALETQLNAIRYLQAEVSIVYGRIPWRILPEPMRETFLATFLKKRLDPALLVLVNQVFAGLPEALIVPGSQVESATSPSQAA